MRSEQKMVTGLLMGILVAFTAAPNVATAQSSRGAHPKGKSCPHQEVKQVPGSRILFEEDSFDFGQIPYNRKVTHVFLFKNAGTSPLLLARHIRSKPVEGC